MTIMGFDNRPMAMVVARSQVEPTSLTRQEEVGSVVLSYTKTQPTRSIDCVHVDAVLEVVATNAIANITTHIVMRPSRKILHRPKRVEDNGRYHAARVPIKLSL